MLLNNQLLEILKQKMWIIFSASYIHEYCVKCCANYC